MEWVEMFLGAEHTFAKMQIIIAIHGFNHLDIHGSFIQIQKKKNKTLAHSWLFEI